jgi:hypothetical protein
VRDDAEVVFLLTDIVGSSARWEQDEESMATLVERHDELIEAAVVGAGGTLVKHRGEGDSTFSVFSSAGTNPSCASTLGRPGLLLAHPRLGQLDRHHQARIWSWCRARRHGGGTERDTPCVWYWSRHGALTGRHVPWIEVLLWVAILAVVTAGIVLTVPMGLPARIFLVTASTLGWAWIFVPLMKRFRRNSSQRRPPDLGRDRPPDRP